MKKPVVLFAALLALFLAGLAADKGGSQHSPGSAGSGTGEGLTEYSSSHTYDLNSPGFVQICVIRY